MLLRMLLRNFCEFALAILGEELREGLRASGEGVRGVLIVVDRGAVRPHLPPSEYLVACLSLFSAHLHDSYPRLMLDKPRAQSTFLQTEFAWTDEFSSSNTNIKNETEYNHVSGRLFISQRPHIFIWL